MLQPLSDAQLRWVESTLDSMSLEQCIGHLLLPYYPGPASDWPRFDAVPPTADDWIEHLRKVPLGSIYLRLTPTDVARKTLGAIQGFSDVPVLVADDLEPGLTGGDGSTATEFPSMMATGAADNEALTYGMARAMAIEHRSHGVHWTFSPVIDLNLNHQNPITNVRSIGDDPALVGRHAVQFVQGIQAQGVMAATAKHFPGDGTDDRDQHLATTMNSLPQAQWHELYGSIWRKVIESGVMTVMAGHISLPDYQGCADRPDQALPATLIPAVS